MSKFELKLPAYPGTSMCVQIGEPIRIDDPGTSPRKYIEKSVEADPLVQVANITFHGHGCTCCRKLFELKSDFVAVAYFSTIRKWFDLQFRKWFDDAKAAVLKEPDAMALSTATKDGKP